jgi:hypothetical protein
MEEWELDYQWLGIRHKVKEIFHRDSLPDLNGVLFMIGIQELGRWGENFSKEEKQDLMHIAACKLLSFDGYYQFEGRDADGWPHYKVMRPLTVTGVKEQAEFLKEKIIQYFRELELEETELEEE